MHYNVQPWVGLLTWDQCQDIALWKKLAGGVSKKFQLPALKTKKKELTCDELAHGKREADAARASLANAGSKLTHSQITRGNMLATEVGRELQREMKARCKA